MFKKYFGAGAPMVCIEECEVRHCPKGFIAKLCYTFTGFFFFSQIFEFMYMS